MIEKNYGLLMFTLFLYFVRLLSSTFQLNFLSETKMMNVLKFKTRETVTTTSPFYTHDVTENISTFSRRRNSVKMSNPVDQVYRWATDGKFFEYLEASKNPGMSCTQFTLTLIIRGLIKIDCLTLPYVRRRYNHNDLFIYTIYFLCSRWRSIAMEP